MRRRRFLSRSVQAAGAGFLAPALIPAASTVGVNERLRFGFLGLRGRAMSLLRGFATLPEVEVAALCDVDSRLVPGAVQAVEELTGGRKPVVSGDFRKLVDDSSIDVLVVGTPDHWHALPTIRACQAGKDVYVEKPDGHDIREGRLMVEAARKYGRVVQVGIQSRSSAHHAEACEYIRSGKLGKVRLAKAWESSRQANLGRPADSEAPDGVDYDMWLGAAPERPFNRLRFHSTWRWFFDYGTGDLGNDGVHRLDYALRGLNAARAAEGLEPVGFPVAVTASGGKLYFDDAQEWPDTYQVNYEYPGAVLVYEMRVWCSYPIEGEREGAAVYGDRGYVVIGNRSWRAYGPDGKPAGPEGSSPGVAHDQAHKRNFIECIRTRKRPACDISEGHVTSVLCHAGNVSWRVGRKLRLDPETETFAGDAEANRYVGRTYRSPWEVPDSV